MRYELALARLREIAEGADEVREPFADFFRAAARFLLLLDQSRDRAVHTKEENAALYRDVLPENYEKSYLNPTWAAAELGKEFGALLSCLFYELRSAIPFVFAGEDERALIRYELFLQIHAAFCQEQEADHPPFARVRDIFYQYLCDYAQLEAEGEIRNFLTQGDERTLRLVREADLTDPSVLYQYGEYVTEDEEGVFAHLNTLSEEQLSAMADTYTEGFRIGFIVTGKDLSTKKITAIHAHIGFERMMRRAVSNFEQMGLVCVIPKMQHTVLSQLRATGGGMETSEPNEQYLYDHRNDIGLFLDKDLVRARIKALGRAYELLGSETRLYAGPAVVETFGREPFSPVMNPDSVQLTKRQQELLGSFRTRAGVLYNEAVIGRQRSFTIISFPLPSICRREGEQSFSYGEIFNAIVRINTLDYQTYQRIQQKLIDALNRADYVHVRGCGANRTDLKVKLFELTDPEKQTIFENCVADVNIPVGEVFTTPVLAGTDGVLHVTGVYLEGLRFDDLSVTFRDGRVADYSCGNFADPEEGRKYIEENILFHHMNLPMSECAIGTNTTAYAEGKRYHIEDRLPILIAEKTGPHFAVGDTCYSHEEDNRVYNPDGKEIVAKDNACSILRKTDPGRAYFGSHMDITIPYDELGSYDAVTKDGEIIPIIRGGRFVLPGTEELNQALEGLA